MREAPRTGVVAARTARARRGRERWGRGATAACRRCAASPRAIRTRGPASGPGHAGRQASWEPPTVRLVGLSAAHALGANWVRTVLSSQSEIAPPVPIAVLEPHASPTRKRPNIAHVAGSVNWTRVEVARFRWPRLPHVAGDRKRPDDDIAFANARCRWPHRDRIRRASSG